MKKTIGIVIGAGSEAVHAINKAREQGVYVVALDGNPDALGFKYAVEALNVDMDGNELLLADIIPTNQTLIMDEVLSNEKERVMYEAVEKLNKREKQIIVLRFGLYGIPELTQKEVADKLGISQSYISRLEKKIIDKLKIEMDKKLEIVLKK